MKATRHERTTEVTRAHLPPAAAGSSGDGTGLRFETGEHGGDYPDDMPQAIMVTDARAGGPSTCHYGSMGRLWCRTIGPTKAGRAP
jgi:hypothetical protein